MTSLGEILLKFGATGTEGEEPLRFKTAHINLLVGPNNAGKSLMLRELSGVNPRGRQRRGRQAEEYASTCIVDQVHWDDEIAGSLQQKIVAEVLASEPSAWCEFKSKTWEQLLPALEQAVPQFTAIRDRLCPALLDLAAAYLASWKELVTMFVQSDTKGAAPLVIGGAVILLQLSHANANPGASEATIPSDPSVKRPAWQLSPEQSTAIRQALEAGWAECEAVFNILGVATQELSLASLLDRNAFGCALLTELAKNPFLRMMMEREPGLLEHATTDAVALARVTRLMEIGGWVFDPEPLERLARQLRESYAQATWANAARRAEMARQVLYLDGIARLNMTRSTDLKGYDEDEGSDEPAILALLRTPEYVDLLRSLTTDALGGHLVIDMTTSAPKVIWRLSQEEPPAGIESSYTKAASEFHAAAVRLDERSDGIHAFVGMLAAILAKLSDLVFIDEPEAFLHPPLNRIAWIQIQA